MRDPKDFRKFLGSTFAALPKFLNSLVDLAVEAIERLLLLPLSLCDLIL
jgi:hypothetical protein